MIVWIVRDASFNYFDDIFLQAPPNFVYETFFDFKYASFNFYIAEQRYIDVIFFLKPNQTYISTCLGVLHKIEMFL